MTPTTLTRTANAATYEDMKLLIYKLIHRFRRKHGGDWDDMLSVAHEAYVTAYNKWDRKIARFSTYLHGRVWGYLMMDLTRRIRRSQAIPMVDIPMTREDEQDGLSLDQVEERPSRKFDASGLSDDVQKVIQLTLAIPSELIGIAKADGEQACDVRSMIANHLRGLGWAWDRVSDTFHEMRKVVTG